MKREMKREMKKTMKKAENRISGYRILVVKIGALGDVLRTTFLLKGLKAKYGKKQHSCHISWLTRKNAKELLLNNNYIDKIYTIENVLAEKEKLPDYFDIVLSLDEEKEPAEIATKLEKGGLIGVYIKKDKTEDKKGEKVTYTRGSSLWFGFGLLRPEELGGRKEADGLKKKNKKTFYELLSKICGIEGKYRNELPILNLTKKEIAFGKKFAAKNRIRPRDLVIGLNTGAGGRWHSKKWPRTKTALLADMLIEKQGAKIILLGGKEESDRNMEIKGLIKNKNNVVDSGQDNTIRQFAAIMELCDVIVTTDTLALHLAVALKKKTIALMATTSAAEIHLFGRGEKICPKKQNLCFYNRECLHRPTCMDLISVVEVFSAVKRQLKKLSQ